MRTWLFILAVLATFKPIVQVASTEDLSMISSNDISLLSPFSSTKTTTSIAVPSVSSEQDSSLSRRSSSSSRRNSLATLEISINDNINSNSDSNHRENSLNRDKPDPESLVEIEKGLLSLFGFKNRPKVDRSKVVIPEAMKKLYAQIMGHELDSVNIPKPGLFTKSANTVRSFTHEDSRIDSRFIHHHTFRLYFNTSKIPRDEKLKAAEVTLSRDGIDDGLLNRTRHQILIYDIVRPGLKGKREPILLLVDSKSVRINDTETISLDVLPAVERWFRTPKENYGLLVRIVAGKQSNEPPVHRHIRLRRSIEESHGEWSHKQPLLFTYTDDGRQKMRSIRDANRSKRAHRRTHRRKDGREICQRRPLYVDFTDVGWSDWIVAPPGYDAFYCHGDCPFPLADHLNSTNHAVVQTLVNSINPSRVPKACCVPTQLAAISMLYLNDQNTVVLKNYQDMAVVGCGCR